MLKLIMNNRNFFIKFFSELSEQINKIETPYINNFLFQTIGIIAVTGFFSLFFHFLSKLWIKFIIILYNIGG